MPGSDMAFGDEWGPTEGDYEIAALEEAAERMRAITAEIAALLGNLSMANTDKDNEAEARKLTDGQTHVWCVRLRDNLSAGLAKLEGC